MNHFAFLLSNDGGENLNWVAGPKLPITSERIIVNKLLQDHPYAPSLNRS